MAFALLSSGGLQAFDDAVISSASKSAPATRPEPSIQSSKPSVTNRPEAGHLDILERSLFGGSTSGFNSSDFQRPESAAPLSATPDLRTQKRLWEEMDRRRHWMFVDPEPGMSRSKPQSLDDPRLFEPSSSRPRSVLQQQAIRDIFEPSTSVKRSGLPSSAAEIPAGTGLLKSDSDLGGRIGKDSRSSESVSGLDLGLRSARGSNMELGSTFGGTGIAEWNQSSRERSQRFDEMFGSAEAQSGLLQADRTARGIDNADPVLSRRERLESLFTSAPAASAGLAPLNNPNGSVDSKILGQAQRESLWKEPRDGAVGPVRRSRQTEEAAKRPVFQPQPSQLELPKLNGF